MKQSIQRLLLLSAFAVASFTTASGQGLEITPPSYTVNTNETAAEGFVEFSGVVFNGFPEAKKVRVRIELQEVTPGHMFSVCWADLCYPPGVNTPEHHREIPAGGTETFFHGRFYPGEFGEPNYPISGTSTVKYVLYDVDNPEITTEMTATVNFGITGINEEPTVQITTISSPNPSPASESASITYSISETATGAIELYSMDSRLLKTFPLAGANGSVVIPTGEFPSGNYFYTLVIDGKRVATNKLVIAH